MDKKDMALAVISGIVGGMLVLVFGGLVGNQSDGPSVGSGSRFPNGLSVDSTSPSAGELRGTTLTITSTASLSGDLTVSGAVTALEETEAITADDTVTASQSGTTFYVSGAESTSTLPAVATATGTVVRYVVAAALSGDYHIDSAEGDNIEGSAIVAGAVVDCDAEDQLNFIGDGENLGDFVELRSDGQKWFLTQSNVLTAAKLTCTDPT